MGRDYFNRDQRGMSYVADKLEYLIKEDFRYKNDEDIFVDRFQGASKEQREKMVNEAKLLVSIIKNVKDRVDLLDDLLSYDSSPETYFPEMEELRVEFENILGFPNVKETQQNKRT